jgi:hypothetical protein
MRATLEIEPGRGKLIDGSEPARRMTSVAAALAGEEATANPKARVFGRRQRPSLHLPARVVAPAEDAAASRGR